MLARSIAAASEQIGEAFRQDRTEGWLFPPPLQGRGWGWGLCMGFGKLSLSGF